MAEPTYTVTLDQLRRLARLGNRVQNVAQVVTDIDEDIGALLSEIAGVESMPSDEDRDEFYAALMDTSNGRLSEARPSA